MSWLDDELQKQGFVLITPKNQSGRYSPSDFQQGQRVRLVLEWYYYPYTTREGVVVDPNFLKKDSSELRAPAIKIKVDKTARYLGDVPKPKKVEKPYTGSFSYSNVRWVFVKEEAEATGCCGE